MSWTFKIFIFSISVFSFGPAYTSDVSELVKKYEQAVEDKISAQKKTDEDRYYIYLLFARELLGLKEYALAKKYYSKALTSGEKASIVDMNEFHYNMLFIRYKEGAGKEELNQFFYC